VPFGKQYPGELGSSGPSQKWGRLSVPGLHMVLMHTAVGQMAFANVVKEQVFNPGPPTGVQSAFD
jgi:hypothetical protein